MKMVRNISKDEEEKRKKILYKRVVREICSEEDSTKDSCDLSDRQKRYIAKNITKSMQSVISTEGEVVKIKSEFIVDYRIFLPDLYSFISKMGCDIYNEFNEEEHFAGCYRENENQVHMITLNKAKNLASYVFCVLYDNGFDIENRKLMYEILRYVCFCDFGESCEDYYRRASEAKQIISDSFGKIENSFIHKDVRLYDVFAKIIYNYENIA